MVVTGYKCNSILEVFNLYMLLKIFHVFNALGSRLYHANENFLTLKMS